MRDDISPIVSAEPHLHWLRVPPTTIVPRSASERQSGGGLGDAAPELRVLFSKQDINSTRINHVANDDEGMLRAWGTRPESGSVLPVVGDVNYYRKDRGYLVMNLDIAVVGGGIAGASSAWRLQQEEGVKKTIGVTTQLQDHIDK